ncbi:DUF6790 family protein [Nocardia thraciensis]
MPYAAQSAFPLVWILIAFLTAPGAMATAIGFTPSPFQFEIAFANLGLAVMGFRAASSSATARERVTIGLGAGIFLWGALIGHVYQWFAHGDHAPGNTGGVLVCDLLFPSVMIILARREQRLPAIERRDPADAPPTARSWSRPAVRPGLRNPVPPRSRAAPRR